MWKLQVSRSNAYGFRRNGPASCLLGSGEDKGETPLPLSLVPCLLWQVEEHEHGDTSMGKLALSFTRCSAVQTPHLHRYSGVELALLAGFVSEPALRA